MILLARSAPHVEVTPVCSSSSRSSGSSSSTSSTSSTTLLAHSGDLPPATVFRLTINSRPYVKSPKRTPSVFLPS